MEENKKLDEAAKNEKAGGKTVEFVCKTKCYWNGTVYHENDVLIVAESEKNKVPEHFELKK